MKVTNALILDKYNNTERYTKVDGFVYKDSDNDVYCVTLHCELEEDEDTQYPLEDILDKYYVNCTDELEEREENGKQIFIFEVEGDSLDAITEIAGFTGKRVYTEHGRLTVE